MFERNRIRGALLTGVLVALVAAEASFAGGADRDSKEIDSYVLTDAALAKYAQATKNLKAHEKDLPSKCDDDKDTNSLDDVVARVNAIPPAKAAITSTGLTTREYFVFMFSLLQNGLAAWALDQPGGKLPPGVSMANVNFIRAHQAAITKLHESAGSTDCDDGRSEDDPQN